MGNLPLVGVCEGNKERDVREGRGFWQARRFAPPRVENPRLDEKLGSPLKGLEKSGKISAKQHFDVLARKNT
jgi:hypothetical protein